jgi:hypothetical protein
VVVVGIEVTHAEDVVADELVGYLGTTGELDRRLDQLDVAIEKKLATRDKEATTAVVSSRILPKPHARFQSRNP